MVEADRRMACFDLSEARVRIRGKLVKFSFPRWLLFREIERISRERGVTASYLSLMINADELTNILCEHLLFCAGAQVFENYPATETWWITREERLSLYIEFVKEIRQLVEELETDEEAKKETLAEIDAEIEMIREKLEREREKKRETASKC